MPLYEFECSKGHKFDRIVKLADFDTAQVCACHAPATRLISKPRFSVDQTGYNCPVTGKWVGSRGAHLDNLARHDCRVLEGGEKEASMARRQAEESAFDKAIEDTVEKTIESYSSAKKEQLHNELVNGKLDLSVDRK